MKMLNPFSHTQWSLDRIGMPLAWTVSTGSTNVVVGVLNTGVNYLHEVATCRQD